LVLLPNNYDMSQPHPASSGHLVQIDSLRTIAIFAVMYAHWMPPSLQLGLPWYSGVTLFYVISGYLITGILLNCRPSDSEASGTLLFSIRQFYIRRFLRIFPLFYGTLFLLLVLGHTRLGNFAGKWPWYVSYLCNFMFSFQGHPAENTLAPFWSLAVEEQFYLVWPWVVVFVPRRFLGCTIASLILVAPAYRVTLAVLAPAADRELLPWACTDALGVGALLAYLQSELVARKRPLEGLGKLMFWSGLAASGALAVNRLFGFVRLPLWVWTLDTSFLSLLYGAIVLRASSGYHGIPGKVLSCQPVVYLGKISYGLYVFHCFAWVFYWYITEKYPVLRKLMPAHLSASWQLVVRLLVYAGFTVGAAMLSWHCYEKPLNDLKAHFPYKKRKLRAETQPDTVARIV
jgi:peptidoglycan/LPS O-acetylase OafA/YrhL